MRNQEMMSIGPVKEEDETLNVSDLIILKEFIQNNPDNPLKESVSQFLEFINTNKFNNKAMIISNKYKNEMIKELKEEYLKQVDIIKKKAQEEELKHKVSKERKKTEQSRRKNEESKNHHLKILDDTANPFLDNAYSCLDKSIATEKSLKVKSKIKETSKNKNKNKSKEVTKENDKGKSAIMNKSKEQSKSNLIHLLKSNKKKKKAENSDSDGFI